MTNSIYILFRNDDPGPLSNVTKERRVAELFERYGIPQVWAVIPNNVEDPHVWHKGGYHLLEENLPMVSLIKEYVQKGLVEVAQHGYTHQTSQFRPSTKDELTENNFYQGIDRKWTAYQPSHAEGYSEFNGLNSDIQQEKIAKGREYLEKILGMKFQSFIFPWNSYSRDCLKILKKQGFKFVPCEDDETILPGLCLIGACNWDWEIDEFRELIAKMETHDKPVLTQFAYHSWEISEEMMQKFESLFRELTAKKNIHFILPHQILQAVGWAPWIIMLRCLMLKLAKRLNCYRHRKIYCPKYYVCDPLFYIAKIIKYSAGLILFKLLKLTNIHRHLLNVKSAR